VELFQFVKLAADLGVTPALGVMAWIGWSVMRSQRELRTIRRDLDEIFHSLDKRVARLEWAAEKRGNDAWQAKARP